MRLNWLKKYNFLIFDSIDNTNDEAVRLALSGVVGDFLIWAYTQTSGKGQRRRKWLSDQNSLTFSIMLHNKIVTAEQKSQMNFLVSAAISAVLRELFLKHKLSHKIHVKWPNDVLVNYKKISGILVESLKYKQEDFFIIGIGINVSSYPVELKNSAISLLELGVETSADFLLNSIVTHLDRDLSYYLQGKYSFQEIKVKWLQNAFRINEHINIWDGTKNISGIFYSVNDDGSIKIKVRENKFQNIFFGDIYDYRSKICIV